MANRYWVGGSGNWNDTSRWAEVANGAGGFSIPTSADNVYLKNPVTVTVPAGYTAACNYLECSNVTGALVVTGTLEIYGNVNVMGVSYLTQGTGQYVMRAAAPDTQQSILSRNFKPPNLVCESFNLYSQSGFQCGNLSVVSGTTSLDSLVCDSISLTGGTLALSGTCTVGSITTSGNNTKTLSLGTSNLTLTAANAFTNTGEKFSIADGQATVYLGGTAAHTAVISGSFYYFTRLVLSNPNAVGFRFSGLGTVENLNAARSGNYAVWIDAGSRLIVGSSFTVNGTAGNIVSLQCTTPGSQGSIQKLKGGTVTTQYMSVKGINASPALTWLSLKSEDLGNNTNWYFDAFYKPNTLLFGSPM